MLSPFRWVSCAILPITFSPMMQFLKNACKLYQSWPLEQKLTLNKKLYPSIDLHIYTCVKVNLINSIIINNNDYYNSNTLLEMRCISCVQYHLARYCHSLPPRMAHEKVSNVWENSLISKATMRASCPTFIDLCFLELAL